jgi:hypothetical protein
MELLESLREVTLKIAIDQLPKNDNLYKYNL